MDLPLAANCSTCVTCWVSLIVASYVNTLLLIGLKVLGKDVSILMFGNAYLSKLHPLKGNNSGYYPDFASRGNLSEL